MHSGDLLGTYDTEEEATAVAINAALEFPNSDVLLYSFWHTTRLFHCVQ